jgi:glycosyltransferase involved in cell wall biosynthesis
MLVDKPLPSERPTGIGVAAFNMALALSKRGITVHLVCRGKTEETSNLNNHLTIHTLRHYSRDNLAAFLAILKGEGCEIIHVHSSSAITSLIAAKTLRRPAVWHAHGDEPLRPIRLTLIRSIGMNLSQRVIATSRSTREAIVRNNHISPRKIVVAYNGVDIEEFRPSSGLSNVMSKYGLEGYDKMILSLGTVQESKGQSKMVECLPKILQRWSRLVYVNVGTPYDAAFQTRLLERTEVLGVSKAVKLFSDLPQSDLVALINAADLCVHPSVKEGFGLAVVEEMACGKAVVAFNVDSLPEIIDNGVDGLLVGPNNKEELTRALSDVIEDWEFAKSLGDAARKKVLGRFTWDRTASRLEQIYGELLG